MFKAITVAVDGSDPGWRALETACDIAVKYNADIHLIHVPEIPQPVVTAGLATIDIPVDAAQVMETGQSIMAEAATRVRAHEMEPHSQIVQVGLPSELVLHTADATASDLIVTGRRGMGSIANLLLGSTSLKIAQNASCACLTVK